MSEKVKTTRKKTAAAGTPAGVRVLTPKDLSLSEEQKRVINATGFAINVRAMLQNWRQGTVAVKGRSDVSFSNKKPWRQKGTGRARAGSARSPLWRSGGICHGPQPRTRTLKVSKFLKQGVMNSLLWNYLEQGNIICLEKNLPIETPKTNVAYGLLKNAGLQGKKINVFVQANDPLTQASFANIKNVRTLFFDQANAYDLANAQSWVVLEKDMNAFKEMVSKWL